MPACLHCGELAPDGALFCAKCGYTLPQVEATPLPPPPPPRASGAPTAIPLPPPPPPALAPTGPVVRPFTPGAPVAFAVPAASLGTTPMAAPASGKYCIRCRTIIARAAVYCPVCQSPQTP